MPASPSAAAEVLRALLVGALVLAAPAALATGNCALPSEVHTLIDQFLGARHQHTFSGTLLLEHNNQRQFVTATSQPGQMVTLQRLNASERLGPVSFPMLGRHASMDACEIGDFYQVAVESGPTVAGRTTRRLTFRPRDTLRFGYVMDLDAATALPLRVATATADGQLLERYEFATIDILDMPALDSASVADNVVPATGKQLQLAALPPGFLEMPNPESSAHLVVSDGLATASVFLEPLPDDVAAGEGTVQHGSTVTYTRGVRAPDTTFLVTVIGEIPVTTARLLASAVRPVRGETPPDP